MSAPCDNQEPADPNPQPYSSYHGFLSDLCNVDYSFRWLHDFFTTPPPNYRHDASTMLILDAASGPSQVTCTSHSTMPDDLSGPEGHRLRMILIESVSHPHINRHMLDAIALYYDVNSIYLRHVLEGDSAAVEYDGVLCLCEVPYAVSDPCAAGIASLDIRHRSRAGPMSAYITKDPITAVPTAIIFGFSERWDTSTQMHLASQTLTVKRPVASISKPHANTNTLANMFRERLLAPELRDTLLYSDAPAVSHLAQCIGLYASLVSRRLALNAQELERETVEFQYVCSADDYPFNDHDSHEGSRISAELRHLTMDLSDALVGLARFRRHHDLDPSGSLLACDEALTDLLSKVSKLQDVMDGCLREQATRLSLLESRKSILLGQNVNLVTRLAFIYLPLTFSTSLFGMNVAELGTGPRPVWSFVVTSLVVATVTLLVWWVASRQSAWMRRQRDHAVILSRFALRSPRLALILACLVVSLEIRKGSAFGCYFLYRNLHLSSLRNYERWTYTQPRRLAWPKDSPWTKHLQQIIHFTNRDFHVWWNDYFYTRWARNIRSLVRQPPATLHHVDP